MNNISKDLQRYILSFLNIEDYQTSKLYLKDTKCKYQEDKIKLFQEVFKNIPNIIFQINKKKINKKNLYKNFIKYNTLDFFCY